MEDFLEQMAEIMEVDAVKPEDFLQSFEAWDSLTTLSIIAFADEDFGVSLSNQEIADAQTIGALYTLIQSKK